MTKSDVSKEVALADREVPVWTAEDRAIADGQGWNLFNINDFTGRGEIQRDDEAQVFPNDQEASEFVQRQARAGDAVAVKAMKICGPADPDGGEALNLPGPSANAQWSPTKGAMTDAQYSARRGCHCPSCGSSTGISGGALEVDGGTAWQKVDCSECGASWSDTYALTGYSDLGGGIDTEAVKSVVEDVKDRREKYGFSVDSEARAREVVSESCDLLDLALSEAEIKIAVSALVS